MPSTRLTHLCLSLDSATARLMDLLARFSELQDLTLDCDSGSLRFLGPLFNLRSLTRLHFSWDGEAMLALHGGALAAIEAEAGTLTSSIVEFSRVVGRRADVEIKARAAR